MKGGRSKKKDLPAALNTILSQRDFSKTITAGFRTCGLYPFDDNAPNYRKCITKSVNTNVDQSDDKVGEEDSLGCLRFLENRIDSDALADFYSTLSSNTPWKGEEKYLELYNLWKSIKNQDSINDGQTQTDADLFIFDFPEFMNTPNETNDCEMQMSDVA